MIQLCIKGSALLALASFAAAGQALAFTPHAQNSTAPLVILAQDEENEEVWHDLRPDITPPEAPVGKREETPNIPSVEKPMGEGSGDIENQELWHDLETGVTPPPGE
jgi:hypothetical protein